MARLTKMGTAPARIDGDLPLSPKKKANATGKTYE